MKKSATSAAGLRLPLLAVVLAAGLAAAIPAAAGARTTGGTAGAAPASATPHSLSTLPGAWRLLPKAPVAKPLVNFGLTVAVWTGSQMIIHGTQFSSSGFSGITFAYRPATGTWTRLPNGPRPITAQSGDSAVWTGSQMLVFGLTAGAYRPSANAWRPIARPPVGPSEISGWTGHEAITWEGFAAATLSTARRLITRAQTSGGQPPHRWSAGPAPWVPGPESSSSWPVASRKSTGHG